MALRNQLVGSSVEEPLYLSFDTECTGLDIYFGSKPFLLTFCDQHYNQTFWEFDVCPFDRTPTIPLEQLADAATLLLSADRLVLQNATFDFGMLETLRPSWELIKKHYEVDWQVPWAKVHDNLISAHMLASCQRKSLDILALTELNINIKPHEDAIDKATQKARNICRSKKFQQVHGIWAMAKEGRADMPSAVTKCFKADMWLPKTLWRLAPDFLPAWGKWTLDDDLDDHPWKTACLDYANYDSGVTLPIHLSHEKKIKHLGLWGIYEERRKILKIVSEMKRIGITLNSDRLNSLTKEYVDKADELHNKCLRIANNPKLKALPVNGTSNILKEVMFKQFALVSNKKTPKGEPCMDKDVLEYWVGELDARSKERHFIESLRQYRQRKTAIGYMKGYVNHWLPIEESEGNQWYRMHPSLNCVGTNTLRWSSSNPNAQNVSKREGFNIRYCFGPLPGRYWASLDYENIELRIPAYESGEKAMVELFEKPNDPPYFGSYHLMNASIVYPEQFWPIAETKGAFKDLYKSTLYGQIKSFGFALSYGAIMKSNGWGTADKAARKQGAHKLVIDNLKEHTALNKHWIDVADRTGYVETMPDLTICKTHGYPVQCSRTSRGKISPTVPLNYHVQSTACWVLFKAMLKVQVFLDEFNANKPETDWWYMILQVHDEIILDIKPVKGYQAILRKIKSIMESCGDDIGVPLKVAGEIHKDNWSDGEPLRT